MSETKGTATYLPLEQSNDLSPDILEGLEQLDLVCLDNIDTISMQPQWQEALFHLYNRIKETGTVLFVSATVPPKQLYLSLKDLSSRLSWGMVYQLNGLQDEDKTKALIMRAKNRGMHMTDEVGQYLLRHFSRSTTDLFKTLEKLDQATLHRNGFAKHHNRGYPLRTQPRSGDRK